MFYNFQDFNFFISQFIIHGYHFLVCNYIYS
nr:MAG TPA: hypothetical protein [Caudoviricetes sp.]